MRYPKVETLLYRTFRRIGRGPSYIGGGYDTSEQIGNYKVESYTDDSGQHFLIWNPNKPCVVMFIEKKTNVAVFNTIEYSPRCTIDGDMKRGDGTRNMIEFAISIAKQHGAVKIELQDESMIECEENGQKVKLGPFSFLRNGKTWYEKYFGFVPTSEYRDEYEHAKHLRKKLLNIAFLQESPCTFFDRKMTNELLRKIELDFYDIIWEKIL